MEGKRTQMEREARELGEPTVVAMHPGLVEVYGRKVETLQTELANDTDPERRQQAITILRSLVDRVVLTPGEGRGKLQIELVGDPWSLMQLARQAEGRAGELDVMTMVAAGARCHHKPTTWPVRAALAKCKGNKPRPPRNETLTKGCR